ncbi:hypothetical protein AA0229_2609 [Gluconobacter cerinus NRIC 0229]|nr:hypothetical protein AA0229_2609 [Gluconobacter cerinus NRIC 0229]
MQGLFRFDASALGFLESALYGRKPLFLLSEKGAGLCQALPLFQTGSTGIRSISRANETVPSPQSAIPADKRLAGLEVRLKSGTSTGIIQQENSVQTAFNSVWSCNQRREGRAGSNPWAV